MYNAEQKMKFIKESTDSQHYARSATSIFEAISKFEEQWGADFCTQEAETIEPAVEAVVGLRKLTIATRIAILQKYCRWCIANGVPGAKDSISKINSAFIGNMRDRTVSGPQQLQIYLDNLFSPVEQNRPDIVYRCYFWLAFAGVSERDAIHVTADEINAMSLTVTHNGRQYPLYREAMPALSSACDLKYFVCHHNNPNYDFEKYRLPGNEILRLTSWTTRGARDDWSDEKTINVMRNAISIRANGSNLNKEVGKRLTYGGAMLSGMFYRKFEQERAGVIVNFKEEADEWARSMQTLPPKSQINNKEKNYYDDYCRWKMAFSV